MLFAFVAVAATSPIAPADDARKVLSEAVEAMGGERWFNPRGLKLEGSATFYSPSSPVPSSQADRYVMWRGIDNKRTSAHGAAGTVRISASYRGKPLFEVGYDGSTSWTDKGIMPKAAADAFWASNMGFGVIRQALGVGFKLERAADRTIDGRDLALIRVIDPAGTATLFGIDKRSRYVRYMGFRSPRGWHERTYDDFLVQRGWVQARKVTLTYDGVKQNEVRWTRVAVDPVLDPALFAPPPGLKELP